MGKYKNAEKKKERQELEAKRLWMQFSEATPEERSILQGLVERAAFLRISLEDMEEDIRLNGFTEMFQQTPNAAAYERDRPIAKKYTELLRHYDETVKKIHAMIKKRGSGTPSGQTAGGYKLEGFAQARPK